MRPSFLTPTLIPQTTCLLLFPLLFSLIGACTPFRDKGEGLEKRTVRELKSFDEPLHVKFYLERGLQAPYNTLRKGMVDLLDRLEDRANGDLTWEFIALKEKKKWRSSYKKLEKKGLRGKIITNEQKGAREEKYIFPGAIISYQGKEHALNPLAGIHGPVDPQVIEQVLKDLEPHLRVLFRKLKREKNPHVAFLHGHGELNKKEVKDVTKAMERAYRVSHIRIGKDPKALKNVDALVIAGPGRLFPERERALIDRFLMRGGKAIWLLDGVEANMDSLDNKEELKAEVANYGLREQLRTYGVRLKKELVKEHSCAPIAFLEEKRKGRPQIEKADWPYYPVRPARATPRLSCRAFVNVKFRFVSSLDTLSRKRVRSSVLIHSSDSASIKDASFNIDPSAVLDKKGLSSKNDGGDSVPLAVLVKGRFASAFKGDSIREEFSKDEWPEQSLSTKMVVVGDGDLIRNRVDKDGNAYPLAYDRYEQKTLYGNKVFFMDLLNELFYGDG